MLRRGNAKDLRKGMHFKNKCGRQFSDVLPNCLLIANVVSHDFISPMASAFVIIPWSGAESLRGALAYLVRRTRGQRLVPRILLQRLFGNVLGRLARVQKRV